MDSATCHLDPAIGETFRTKETEVKYIDSGMTPILQFMDTHLNKPFKDSLKDQWEEWLDNGKEEFTKSGNRKRASYQMAAEWVYKAWREVAKDDIIVRGFLENGYIDWGGNYAQCHSRLRETIESRDVPREVLDEVDNVISGNA